MASDAPIPAPAETQDERMFRLRSAYSSALNDILDRVLNELILMDDQAALLADFSQFAKFLACVKLAEISGEPGDKAAMLKAFWHMHAAERHEVPDQLRATAAAAQEQAR